MAWTLALKHKDRTINLLSTWALLEGGLTITSGKRTMDVSDQTGPTTRIVDIGLELDLKSTGIDDLIRQYRDMFWMFTQIERLKDTTTRDPVYLVMRFDDGTSGSVLYGRGDVYFEILQASFTMPPDALSNALVLGYSFSPIGINLTCKAGKGRQTFAAEAVGWVHFDQDGNLNIWEGGVNLLLNPSFEHATLTTDWAVSDASLVAAFEYERIHQMKDTITFKSCKLVNTDAALPRQLVSAKTLTQAVYALVAHVYTDGTVVSSDECTLWFAGVELTPVAYVADPDNPGWYHIWCHGNGLTTAANYGVNVKPIKTVFVDNLSLVRVTTENMTGNTNLLTNGSFETAGGGGADVFDSWTETADDGAIADSATAYSGTHACQLTGGAATRLTRVVQNVTVVAGSTYLLTWYQRGDAGATAGRFRVRDESNAADIRAIVTTGITAAAYAHCSYRFVAPTGCTSVGIYFYCPDANTSVCYVDLVQVQLVNVSGWYQPVILGNQGPGLAWTSAPTTPHNSTATRTAGQVRQRVQVAANPGFETLFYGKGVISVWVTFEWAADDGVNHEILNTGETSTVNAMRLAKASDNYLNFTMFGSTNNGYKMLRYAVNTTTFASSTVASKTWHHIVVVWDETGPLYLYLNGTSVGSSVTGGTWTNMKQLGSYFYIGTTTSATNQFNGWIGDLRIFGSDATVTALTLYNSGRGKSHMGYMITGTAGGIVQSTKDSTNNNEVWLANLPGDFTVPIKMLFHNDGGSWSTFAFSWHKRSVFPYRLNVFESVDAYQDVGTPATQVDATRSGGGYERINAATLYYYMNLIDDGRWARYVADRYQVLACMQDGAASIGNYIYRFNIAMDGHNESAAAALSTHANYGLLSDQVSCAALAAWEVVYLGDYDIPIVRQVLHTFDQNRIAITAETHGIHCSLMLYGDSASDVASNQDLDQFCLMPYEGMIKGTVATNTILIVDAIDRQTYYCNELAGSTISVQAQQWAEFTGEFPDVSPFNWLFGNFLTSLPANAVNLFVIYEPQYAWGQ